MASWRDSISEIGSFRDVPFFYESVSGEIGRRTALKEYPGRDKPRVEDLGLATRTFTIEMFFLGDEYPVERDRMREAFETAGPGELVHPYWGTMQVTVVGTVHWTESTKQGGMAKCSAKFVEAGADDLDVVEREATEEVIVVSAAEVRAAVAAQFAAAYSVVHAVSEVVQSAINAVNDVTSAVNAVRGKIAAALLLIDSATAAINAIVDSVEALVNTPALLASSLTGMVTAVVEGVSSIGEAFETAIDFFDGEDTLPAEGNVIAARARVEALSRAISGLSVVTDVLTTVGPGTAQQQSIKRLNQESLVRLVKASVIASVAETAVELDFESYTQAQSLREQITDMVDALLTDSGVSDELYGPLVDLRAAVTVHFEGVASSLPELSEHTPIVTMPALLIAYQLYGDISREPEILARNPTIRDQSAVPGGQAIKVLIDG